MLDKLFLAHPENNVVYYFDTSFEETLKRHATKSNADEFGEVEMRRWYRASDLSGLEGETIIPEDWSLRQSVDYIQESSCL